MKEKSKTSLKGDSDREKTAMSRLTPSPNSEMQSRCQTNEGITFEPSKKRKKKGNQKGGHSVTFTVTVCQAVPTVDNEVESVEKDKDGKKKKRIMEAPKAHGYYHLEYTLLPEDDDVVKTDLVTFGIAAKIYTEKHEPKVIKTWQDGNMTWVAWTQIHSVNMSDDLLLKLFEHSLEMRIWDTRDKLSARAKFDRPKAFKLPQPKPGEDPESVGGVKTLVLKQSRNFEKLQPKRQYINRPLPSASRNYVDRDSLGGGRRSEEVDKPATRESVRKGVKSSLDKTPEQLETPCMPPGGDGQSSDAAAADGGPVRPPTQGSLVPAQDGSGPVRSYSRLGRLAISDQEENKDNAGASQGPDSRASQARSRTMAPPVSRQKPGPSEAKALAKLKDALKAADDDSIIDGKPTLEVTKGRRNRKAEALAAAAAEHARKYGVGMIPIRMATFFSGIQSVTNRLDNDLPGLDDMFVTVSLSGPLMSEEQCRQLNPLIIKVHSATDMPNTPINYADLRLLCQPAYVKYSFYKQAPHQSVGREQEQAVYWEDIHVVLTGTLDNSELREYLNGPPLEIEVHDRDRTVEKAKLMPTLFGDDLEDEKINNVGVVTSKRTTHNPFGGRGQPWDPYGVAKFDLSGLLQGQKVLHLKAPIHNCSIPDQLGMKDGRSDEKLLGVAGAVDGPTETPLAAGHYLQSNAMMKIRVEITSPLTTPESVAANEPIETTLQCPFGRIVFKFNYHNVRLLHELQNSIKCINASALVLTHLPQHVVDAALSTYKLSLEQQSSRELDIVTGFQLMDGEMHLFILEGLRDGAITHLWNALPKQEDEDLEVLYNSDLSFHERLYGPLDVDLCRIKLHEPLSLIVTQPLLYVRDMVPKPCFQALIKIDQMIKSHKLRDVIRNDLFPTADMVVSMSREFGVPLTAQDFEELQPVAEYSEPPPVNIVDIPHTSRAWTPIDNFNPDYEDQLYMREQSAPVHNYLSENKARLFEHSEENRKHRMRTAPKTIKALSAPPHNYSTQSLNSTEQAKEALQQVLAQDPGTLYTYCPDYHHSMTVVPVNVPAKHKAEREASKNAWKTPTGWIYPGKKTMREGNVHPMKPNLARLDQLEDEWVENTLHANILKPTLSRDRYTWSKRVHDMDVWTRPYPLFGQDEPATIHLAGQKLKQERLQSQLADTAKWHQKVIVEDNEMNFHRCAPATEMKLAGIQASNQLARLQGLLKDQPQKLALLRPGFSMREIPPLNVVLNPSVDTAARLEGVPIPPGTPEQREISKGFMPGPHADKSWNLECNKIPSHNYQHERFRESKGHDFNVYHKDHSVLHRQPIPPLTDQEYTMPLFRWPKEITMPPIGAKPYYLPEESDITFIKSRHTTKDSGFGTFLQNQNCQKAVESSY